MNNINFKKITILSDTHMRLSKNTYHTIIGNFDKSNIYSAEVLTDNNETLKNFYLKKDQLNKQKPSLIFHAGDVGTQEILDNLQEIAPIVAVYGNCDFTDLRTKNKPLNDFEYLIYENIPIAIAHVPNWLESYISGSFLKKSKIPNGSPKPKLKIHGHTHEAEIIIESDNNVTICPGSATQGRYGSPNSIANVYIANGMLVYTELISV